MKTQAAVCPKCQKQYPCPAFMVGKKIKCDCGTEFIASQVPEPTEGTPSAPPATAAAAAAAAVTAPAPASAPAPVSGGEISYNGKISEGSSGILDDQAKVLFDYFKTAAEHIVGEEDRIESEIKGNEAAKLTAQNAIKSNKTLVLVLAIVAALFALSAIKVGIAVLLLTVGCGVGALLAHQKAVKAQAEVLRLETILANLQSDFKGIKRDYAVNKLGVVYVPVASRVPFENRSFLLDHTELAPQKEFSLFMLKDQGSFVESVRTIDRVLQEVPVVEGSEQAEKVNTSRVSRSLEQITYYDYLGSLDRSLRDAGYQIGDQNKISVSLPVILPKSDLAEKLETYGTENIGAGKVLGVFRMNAYDEHLNRFMELNELRRSLAAESRDFERFLEALIQRTAAQVQLLGTLKQKTASELVSYASELLLLSFKASYNHYSKELEAEEINRIGTERFDFQESVDSYKPFHLHPSSRMHFDLLSQNWVAEDGSRSSFPFGVHQIQEEIIAPVVESLMAETRLQRLEIYNNIKDQKLDYLNQWHRDVDDFYGRGRAEANDIIIMMQASITELTTALSQYKAFDSAEKGMVGSSDPSSDAGIVKEDASAAAMSVAACESQVSQIRTEEEEFNQYVLRLKEDIDRRSGVYGHVRYYDASLRDQMPHDIAHSETLIATMDPRRHVLLKVNPLVADRAKLPPKPDIDQQVEKEAGLNLKDHADQVVALLNSELAELNKSKL